MRGDKTLEIYDKLEERLNKLGIITTQEAWSICGGSYGTLATNFKRIMDGMTEQGKATKLRSGEWRIRRADNPIKEDITFSVSCLLIKKLGGDNKFRQLFTEFLIEKGYASKEDLIDKVAGL